MCIRARLYIERGGGRVYQYGYDYESDGYVSREDVYKRQPVYQCYVVHTERSL